MNHIIDRLLYGWMDGGDVYTHHLGSLLAEDEQGDLLVPSRTRADWWDRRFNPRNPLHWPYWVRSRVRRNVVMVERGEG